MVFSVIRQKIKKGLYRKVLLLPNKFNLPATELNPQAGKFKLA
jgi:hypothetical protein